jgi:hypothetical protein
MTIPVQPAFPMPNGGENRECRNRRMTPVQVRKRGDTVAEWTNFYVTTARAIYRELKDAAAAVKARQADQTLDPQEIATWVQ